MANRAGNKILADSTGVVVDTSHKIAYILFTPNAANDEMMIRETASGADCFYVRAATAKDTKEFDFSHCPMFFPNGIYIETLTSGAKVVFVTTQGLAGQGV